MRKDIANQSVTFHLTSTTDGSDITSGAPTVYVTKDNGAEAAGTGTLTHKGHGAWTYVPVQAETNAAHVAFTIVLAGAVSQTVNLYPVAYDPGDAAGLGLSRLDAAISTIPTAQEIRDYFQTNTIAVELTAAAVDIVVAAVDAGLLNAGDATDLIASIVSRIGNTNVDETAFVAALKAALFDAGSQANKLAVDASGRVTTSNDGPGPHTLTVTVDDGTNPLTNATVRVTDGGGVDLSQPSDGSGEAEFLVPTGTYDITAFKSGGYQQAAAVSKAVSADDTATVTLTPPSGAPLSDPGTATGTAVVLDEDNDREPSVEFTVTLKSLPDGSTGLIGDTKPRLFTSLTQAEATSQGGGAQEGDLYLTNLIWGATYTIAPGDQTSTPAEPLSELAVRAQGKVATILVPDGVASFVIGSLVRRDAE